ncbi:MAG: hypothetical protein VX899_16360 [Myxococcota bacterium]|nr:hypothetical protein [Myxococcota bacterium]
MFLLALLLACPSNRPSTQEDPVDSSDDTADTQDTGALPGILEEPLAPLVEITGPNYGEALATGASSVTLVGVADDSVVSLTWESGDQSGSIPVGSPWTVADVPLSEGDNTLRVVAVDGDGQEDSDTLLVSFSEGSPLDGHLVLSAPLLLAGEPSTLAAQVWLSGDADEVVVGPADESGTLLETWVTLSDQGDGRWRGEAELTLDLPETYSVRAVARVGGAEHGTPPVELAVVENTVQDSLEAINALLDAAETAQLAESDPQAGLLAAQRVLAADPRVLGTLLTPESAVEAIFENGVHFGLLAPEAEYKGGGGSGLNYDGALTLGTERAQLSGTGALATENNDLVVVSPWADEFNAFESGPELMEMAGQATCPQVGNASNPSNSSADLLTTAQALFGAGLVHVNSHGTLLRLRPRRRGAAIEGVEISRRGQGVVVSREPATLENINRSAREYLGGTLAVFRWKRANWLAWSGPWVQALSIQTNAFLPNSIVVLDACNTGTTREPAASLLFAGAGGVRGVKRSIRFDQSLSSGIAFWEAIFEWQDSEQAGQAVQDMWTQKDASPVGFGSPTRMASSALENGGFEDGVSPWIGGAGDPLSVTSGVLGYVAQSGSKMGVLYLKDGETKTYASMRNPVCLYPGEDVTLSFSWRAVTREAGSCSASNPQYLIARHDTIEERESLLHLSWSQICADMVDNGWRETPWQTARLDYSVPETEFPDEVYVSLATGGYGSDIWYLLFDDIKLEPSAP